VIRVPVGKRGTLRMIPAPLIGDRVARCRVKDKAFAYASFEDVRSSTHSTVLNGV
jgi:hypothetical protein